MDITKAGIPISWAATIVMSIVGLAGTAATSHYRLGELEREWGNTKAVLAVSDKTAREHELKLQKLEIILDSIRVSLDKIDSRLERMESKK
jgi:hypothetical protein